MLPNNCELLGSTKNCLISSFSKGNHIFSIQSHPEFDFRFMRDIVNKYEEMLGPNIYDEASASLSKDVDGDAFGLWCENFIKLNYS